MLIMGELLKVALDEQRYDLAAYVLVYGLIKTMQGEFPKDAERLLVEKQNDKKKHRKGQETGILRPGTG